jgi:ABC-2 type transport system permease protein
VPETPPLRVQAGQIALRSIRRTLRLPIVIVPNALLPLILLAIQASGADQATDIKGFPTDSYLTFTLAATFVQGAIGAATVVGTTAGFDVESGFMSRLSLTPISGGALLLGQLAGAAVVGLFQSVIYVVVGVVAGASIETGIAGGVALVGFTVLLTFAFGAIGLLAALRTGDPQRVQAIFPLMLALLFMSSMAMPRNLIDTSWFKTVATYNPMSYLVEAPRSLLISGWDAEALALGGGIAAAMLLLALAGSRKALQDRMERT